MSITKYLCHRTLNDVKFMRDKDSFCLRMHFCPSFTSFPECTHDYWALQCERMEEKDEELGGRVHERVSLSERSLSISQQAY